MPLPWSYSTLLEFESCPYKTKLKKIDKVPDGSDDNPIFIDGTEKHKLLEDYVISLKEGTQTQFPKCADKLQDHLESIFESYELDNIHPEKKYAFDKDFKLLDDFFHKDVWLRAVVDLMAADDEKMVIIDYKSGKFNPYVQFKNQGQLQLYAVIGFLTNPNINTITTSLLYMKDGKIVTKEYERKKLPALMSSFINRGNNMFYAQHFPAKPSKNACKWCGYKEQICEYATE